MFLGSTDLAAFWAELTALMACGAVVKWLYGCPEKARRFYIALAHLTNYSTNITGILTQKAHVILQHMNVCRNPSSC